MKKLIFFSAVILLSTYSCQKDDELTTNPSSDSSSVDPSTPLGATPLIIDGSTTNSKTQAPPGTGWTLKASDEFSGTALDTKKWTVEVSKVSRGLGRNPDIKWWGWVANLVSVSNGALNLSSKKATSSRLECACVISNNKIERKYGFYESSIDVQDPSKGSHTAFWLQGDNMNDITLDGENGAEIDIFESAWVGNVSRTTVHIDGYSKPDHESTGGGESDDWTAPDLDNGYRTFGLDWSKTYLKTYYNGNLKKTITGKKWIPLVNEYILLSTGASFGSGKGGFTNLKVGDVLTSKVDWIRIYNKDSDPNYK